MIFITVGTHEQGMERLLKEIDNLIENKIIEDKVIAQIGYSTYKPINYEYEELIGYDHMDKLVRNADIVITHGGPGSIFHPIQYKKIPVVVPRNPDFNEHVDNHQILFTKTLEENKKIIAVYDIKDLGKTIKNYYELAKLCDGNGQGNNDFVKKFSELIDKKFKF